MSENKNKLEFSRREFLKAGTTAVAGAAIAKSGFAMDLEPAALDLEEKTIVELQSLMSSGRLTAVRLVHLYTQRIEAIDKSGPKLTSVIEVNPEAREIASQLDAERAAGHVRGPLHGIPVLLKDNIDTADRMQSAAGSLALVGQAPAQDSTVAKRLRNAGAIILGKANLSEWANFRGFSSSSGWSGRGGQCRNPYLLIRNPCGSSSGSAAAVAANLCAASLGTETDGSIVCPSNNCGIVGIKPTVGLTSRAGVVPISHSQDTVGPHGRTVADAAIMLGALTGVDPRDPATSKSEGKFFRDYTQFLDPNGLSGARIGVARSGSFFGYSEETDAIIEEAIDAIAQAGATIIDPADIPTADTLFSDPAELIVLIYEFKRDLNAYLATRSGVPISTLADAIAFNQSNADQELKFFGQQIFELAEAEIFSRADYVDALKRGHTLARKQGIDAVIRANNLDAIVAPTGSPAWTTDLVNGDHFTGASSYVSAVAGYPIINMPAGFAFGLPVGISFMGRAFSEATLIKLASGFENATHVRRAPQFRTKDIGATETDLKRARRHRSVEIDWDKQRKVYSAAVKKTSLLNLRGRL